MTAVAREIDSLKPPPTSADLPIELRFLLGDSGTDLRINEWPFDAKKRLDQEETPIAAFEHACACFYDSRLEDAREGFQVAPSPDDFGHAMLHLGSGKVYNAKALFKAAHHEHELALGRVFARPMSDPVRNVTTCFYLLNRSDLGTLDEQDLALLKEIEQEPLLGAAEAVRRHSIGRIMLRRGRKVEALALLESYWKGPELKTIPKLYQAHVARLVGALLTLTGRQLSARHALQEAYRLFDEIGYHRGVLKTVLSLTRTYGSLDPGRARTYLKLAQRILDNTDPLHHVRAGARTMPKEWSDYYARSGDLAFAAGEFSSAEAMYRRDISIINELQYGDTDTLVREAAYAHRNVGKALLALHHFLPAATELGQSAQLFRKVQDHLGAFYSECQQCRAQIRAGRFDDAKLLLASIEAFLSENTPLVKERGILHMLQAQIAWMKNKNGLEARRLIAMAKQALGARRDHYYLFTLLLEARIFADTGDRPAARRILFEAWRRSSSADMADVRQDVEALLDVVGVLPNRVDEFDLTRLEQDCKQKGNVHADLTILYADIRGFTDACTRIDAHRMADFIGEFAKLVSTSVARNDGLPCRFLGDCVMALFGVRDEDEDSKVRLALAAVHEIYELFTGLRERWADHTPELKQVGLGCGVATGTVVAGRFGAAGLLEFSVIGEPVNLASRIQGKAEDGKVMLCQRTAEVTHRSLGLTGKVEKAELKGFGERTITLVDVSEVAATLRSRESIPPATPNIRPIVSAVRNR